MTIINTIFPGKDIFIEDKEAQAESLRLYNEILQYLKEILDGTEFENHVFTVGGCERDRILERTIKDIDLVVDMPNGGILFAKWLQEKELTKFDVVTYEHYGTAMFTLREFPGIEIEAVQTRKECYRDIESRNPETAFGTIIEDCGRRDFTINAIYRNISTGKVIDYTGRSLRDLENKLIVSCGDPDIIFNEDPLRILRAVRFNFKYDNFRIDDNTYSGMLRNMHRLSIVSQERITDEFTKMIRSDFAFEAFEMLKNIGALQYIFPFQNDEKVENFYLKFLIVDNTINKMPRDCDVRLSRIFIHLLDTEIEGLMRNMKYSNHIIKGVLWYVNHADWSVFEKDYSLRKFLYETKGNKSRLYNSMEIFKALGCDISSLKARMKNNFKFYTYNLPVNGDDILETLGISNGPIIGLILDELLSEAFKNPDISKFDCLNAAHKIYRRLNNDGTIFVKENIKKESK